MKEFETYGFGDGNNDVPMFKVVKNKIAMGNAVDELKSKATFVTLDFKDGGILHAIKKLGVI